MTKKVYSKTAFTIIIDKTCNADCSFCVWKQYNDCVTQDCSKDKRYFQRLEVVIEKVLAPLKLTACITGGEPSKSHRLPKVLKLLAKYGMQNVVFNTNGSGLLDIMDGAMVIEHLVDHKVSRINISQAHHDPAVNQNIMQFMSGCNAVNKPMLREIVQYASGQGIKVRMSCLLLRNGINSISKIREYLDFYQELGVRDVVFRELLDVRPEDVVDNIKNQYCDTHKVSVHSIWQDMEQSSDFKLLKKLRRHYYYVEVWKYKDMEIAMTDASLVELGQRYVDDPSVIYDLVFHANGKLAHSWTENKDILM